MPDLTWLFPGTVVQPTGPQPMQNPGGMGLMPAAPAMLPPNAMREEDMTVSYPTRFPNDTYYGNNMQSAGGAAIANPAIVNQGGGRFEEDGGVSYPRTYQQFMAPTPPMPTPVPTPPPPARGDGYFDNSMQWGGGAAVANPALIVQGGGRYEEDGSVTYPAAPSQKMQWPFPAPPKPRY